jgi:hypothetical protein
MSPADVLPPVDRRPTTVTAPEAPRPATGRRDLGITEQATAAVERAVADLLRALPAEGDGELRALDAIARAAARLVAERRPERRPTDADVPFGAAGWWSFAAQLPEVDL